MRSALLDAMPSNFTVRAYANYDDDQLSPAQWKSEYFAQDYGRLLEIKSAVDPNNLFRCA